MQNIKRKIVFILCICMLILPITSYGLQPEEFFKFLIESSYPETVDEEKEVSNEELEINVENEEETIEEVINENNETEEGDFFKVYVGEENIPEPVETSNDIEIISSSTTAEYLRGYTNETKVTGENPTMFIYHTHAGEKYYDSPSGNYHS